MASKPKLLARAWEKAKKPIIAGLSGLGNLLVPGLGSAAGVILEKIPTMSEKAIEQGVIKQEKIAETLKKSNAPVTTESVQLVTEMIQEQVKNSIATTARSLPVNTLVETVPVEKTKIDYKQLYLKYWFVLPIVAVMYVFMSKKPKYKNKRYAKSSRW